MPFSLKTSLASAFKSSWIILKLIVPIYIIADLLFYYDLLRHITFLFTPIVALLDLPPEAALSIVSGLFLNLYAAIAFAAPLGLTPKEWTILAVFLGIAHSLLVETEIMRRLGIARLYSITLRLSMGLGVGFLTTTLPDSWFQTSIKLTSQESTQRATSLLELLSNSLYESLLLSLQIIALVSVLIFFLDYIKSLQWVRQHAQKVNSSFSITVGVVLGITYGATLLINEYDKGELDKKAILFIGTYLMVCHAIIEDTLLFVIFGANAWVIVTLRLFFATLASYAILKVWRA